jgi:outer membrane protein OmpA-like peptidoglycan-associated protein
METLMIRLGLIVALVISATACMSTDPYIGDQKVSNTVKGASIGAVTKAIISAATSSKDDRKKGVLIAAVAGEVIGVGFYMDNQPTALGQQLAGTGVRVADEGDNIRLIMPGNISFDVNRFDIRGQFLPALGSVGGVVAEFDKTTVMVEEHADSTGSFESNQVLSENRAVSVTNYLTQQGVASNRVQSQGLGPHYPIACQRVSLWSRAKPARRAAVAANGAVIV